MKIRRWHDGKILAEQPLMDMAGYIGHRGDYHDIFLKWVRERDIPILMGSEVTAYSDPPSNKNPSITLSTGTTLTADLIVASDGIKSLARNLVLGAVDDPVSSGYACFRAYFSPSEEMLADPARNAYLVGGDSVNFWIGPDTHVVQNTLRGGREFNWILTHRDEGDVPESWFQPGDMNEVRKLVADIDPAIREAIRSTEKCLDWKICYRKPLESWVSPVGHRIVLLGDSCHAHLPTSAQGASQACESAGVLGACLRLGTESGDGDRGVRIAVATRTYEKLRFPRTRVSQTHGEDLRDRWHNVLKDVTDGDVEIDPEMVKIKASLSFLSFLYFHLLSASPHPLLLSFLSIYLHDLDLELVAHHETDKRKQNRPLYAFDAEQDAYDRWEEISRRVRQELESGRIEPLCD